MGKYTNKYIYAAKAHTLFGIWQRVAILNGKHFRDADKNWGDGERTQRRPIEKALEKESLKWKWKRISGD